MLAQVSDENEFALMSELSDLLKSGRRYMVHSGHQRRNMDSGLLTQSKLFGTHPLAVTSSKNVGQVWKWKTVEETKTGTAARYLKITANFLPRQRRAGSELVHLLRESMATSRFRTPPVSPLGAHVVITWYRPVPFISSQTRR